MTTTTTVQNDGTTSPSTMTTNTTVGKINVAAQRAKVEAQFTALLNGIHTSSPTCRRSSSSRARSQGAGRFSAAGPHRCGREDQDGATGARRRGRGGGAVRRRHHATGRRAEDLPSEPFREEEPQAPDLRVHPGQDDAEERGRQGSERGQGQGHAHGDRHQGQKQRKAAVQALAASATVQAPATTPATAPVSTPATAPVTATAPAAGK